MRILTAILSLSNTERCTGETQTGSDAVDAILYAAHRIRTSADAALREHGLSLPGLKLLTALAGGDRSMREISQVLHVSPRTVTDMIDTLEGRGLVARCAHATDRRITLLRLAEAGAASWPPPAPPRSVSPPPRSAPWTRTSSAPCRASWSESASGPASRRADGPQRDTLPAVSRTA